MKKLLSLAVAGAIAAIPIGVAFAEATSSHRAELTQAIVADTERFISSCGLDMNIYKNMNWTDISDTLPAKFDLRDRGVVPSVRDQGNWGTCWGFASIAATETSILSTLGMTNAEFAEATGNEIDLSEKHLAWFATGHLPTTDQYPAGEYPYDPSQAGEGQWHQNEETDPNSAHYLAGGYMAYASSVFANGTGPVLEEDCPYQGADGSDSTAADWSVPEEERYQMTMELVNSSILPIPATRDAEGKYVYDPAGTQAIKQELLAGRGVSVCYYADQNLSPEVRLEMTKKSYIECGFSDEVAEVCALVDTGALALTDMDRDQKLAYVYMCAIMGGYSEEELTEEILGTIVDEQWDEIVEQYAQAQAQLSEETGEQSDEEDEAVLEAMKALGMDPEKMYVDDGEQRDPEQEYYYDPYTNAQYCDNPEAYTNHSVCIVGWDDDYDVSNFRSDRQPPANGAWIVRNSWGADYDNDGYFYLSYYDMSFTIAETFEFRVDDDALGGVFVCGYDNMQASSISSVHMETPVMMANVIPNAEDNVLTGVSVMTADLNAQVTVSVYLLNEDPTSPVDGILLDSVTETFEFAGYHRIELEHSYVIPAGAVISIVQSQRTDTTEGVRYTVPYVNDIGKEASDLILIINPLPEGFETQTWSVGVINEGESFVRVDDEWIDWKTIVDNVKASSSVAALAEFDNLSMKAYFYSVETVAENHAFGEPQNHLGSEAYICEDCGYVLVALTELP